MRVRAVASSLGSIVSVASVVFVVPAVLAWFIEPHDTRALGRMLPLATLVFGLCAVAGVALGQAVRVLAGRAPELRDIEAYVIVALGWLVVPALFAIPLYFTGATPTVVDALFEGMSGVTTTGFTILPDVDAVPQTAIFWRSFMQWIGGVGIAVLSVAVLARLTESGARLMRAELPGSSGTRLRPKIAQTAKSLYGVYLTLSVLVFGALFAALFFSEGLGWREALWEAVNLTFSSVATGGFVPHSDGLAHYASDWVRHIILAAMVLGGTSLTLLYFAAHGDPRRLLRDLEWRTFILMLLAASALIAAILVGTRPGAWDQAGDVWAGIGVEQAYTVDAYAAAFMVALFNVTSIVTTAGFSTMDFDRWPEAARIIFLLLAFTGACAGSTTGALKLARVILLAKVARREIAKLINPNAYVPVRIGAAIVSEDTIRGIIAFFFAYVSLFIASTVFVALFGYDVFTSASVSAAAIGNVGVGLAEVGPCCSLSTFHPVVKVWLTFLMWVGRLEIFAAILLFVPSTYQR